MICYRMISFSKRLVGSEICTTLLAVVAKLFLLKNQEPWIFTFHLTNWCWWRPFSDFFSTISGIKFKLGRYPNVICAILLKNLDRFSASTASLYSKPKTETTGNDMVALTNWYSANSDINEDATFFILLLNYKRWAAVSSFSHSPKQASVFIWKHC